MSTIIIAIIQMAAFCVAAWSLWMVYQQHRYRILVDLHKELLGDEMQKSLRLVFSMKAERLATPTEAELAHIERVLGVYDLIGLRAKQRAINCKDLLASDWRILLPLGQKVEPFVLKQCKLRNCPSYKEFFRWLVDRAAKYRDHHHPGQEPKPFDKRDLVRKEGCSMIFINDEKKVLLYRRDGNPSIPEPGKWDLFGGHIEAEEKPDEAIVREIREELGVRGEAYAGIRLTEYRRFGTYSFADRDEHVYWSSLNQPESELVIKEGQTPCWFSQTEIENLDIGFGFKDVLRDFFQGWPKSKDDLREPSGG
jgi:mutator protein MutT